jgi:hypothetical protein
MTPAQEALSSLLFALLKFHSFQESAGKVYELPDSLSAVLADKLTIYAQQNDVAPAIFLAAIKDLLFVSEPDLRSPQAVASEQPPSTDFFGTYLEGIRGRSALEQVLSLVRIRPRSLAELVNELDFTAEEIVSATAKAQQLGMVTLEQTNEQTTVHLVGPVG